MWFGGRVLQGLHPVKRTFAVDAVSLFTLKASDAPITDGLISKTPPIYLTQRPFQGEAFWGFPENGS